MNCLLAVKYSVRLKEFEEFWLKGDSEWKLWDRTIFATLEVVTSMCKVMKRDVRGQIFSHD